MTVWLDAAWTTPKLRPMEIETDGDLSTVYLSKPVLVYTAEGEQLVCRYERDPETGFDGFITEDGAQPTVTHWTALPKPPGRRMEHECRGGGWNMNDPITIQMPDGSVLYHCNPDLATDCKKSHCFRFGGPCSMTPRKEWACVTVGDLIRRKDNSQLAEYLSGKCACPPVNCDALNVTCRTCWYQFLSSPAAEAMDL